MFGKQVKLWKKLNFKFILQKRHNYTYIYRYRQRKHEKITLGIVLDGEVLAAHHAIALEPLAAELLGGPFRRVRPFDGDAVVAGVFGGKVERIARDGPQYVFLRVEHSARRVHSQALRVRGLDRPADATRTRVDDLEKNGLDVRK